MLTAGRDINEGGNTVATQSTTNSVTMTAGRNITLFGQALVATSGGPISLSTGIGGVFSATGPAFTDGAVVDTTQFNAASTGNITISSDDMVLSGPVTNSGGGITTLQQATGGAGSTPVNIDLGGGTTVGDLDLSDTALSTVTAGILRIGRSDNAGNLTITAPVTTQTGFNTLSLRTGGAILDANTTATVDLTVTNLALQAVNGIAELNLDVTTVAASNTTSGSIQLAENSGGLANLTVGTVDGVVGVTNTATTNLNATEIESQDGNLTIDNNVTAPDNVFLEAGGSGNTFTNNAAIFTSSAGGIGIAADSMSLAGGTIAVLDGAGVDLNVITPTENITLGTTVANTLSLLQTDLNTITAGVLTIGGTIGGTPGSITPTTGSLTITAPITDVSTGWTTLSLVSGGVIATTGPGTLTVNYLAASTTSDVNLDTTANAVSEVGGSSTGGAFALLDSVALTVTQPPTFIGNVPSGITSGLGTSLLSSVANTLLTVNQPITAGGNVVLQFDNMALNASVDPAAVASHRVTLEPFSNGQLINLGGADATGTLGLTNTELNEVTAGVLQVGNSTSGAVTVSGAITPANVPTLDLETGNAVTETTNPTPGTLTVPDLVIRAFGPVMLTNANDVTGPLAVNINGAGEGLNFTNADSLTVGSSDGLNGLTINGGAVTISAGAGLNVSQDVDASNGVVVLNGNGPINVNAPITGSTATVNGGSGADVIVVTTTGTTPLNVNGGAGNNTVFVQALSGLLGSILGSTVNVNAGSGTNTLGITEENGSGGDAVTVTPTQIIGSGASPFTINYGATGGSFGLIGLALGTGNNNVNVTGTPGLMLITTGAGNNNVAVTASSGLLGSVLKGPLSIDEGSGTNTLSVSEVNASTADSVVVSANAIVGDGTQPFVISYAATGGTFSSIGLSLSSGNNAVGVESTAAQTIIAAGAGNDTVCVSAANGGLLGNVLNGPLLLALGGGSNQLAVFEPNATTADKLFVASNQIVGQGAQPFTIDYSASGGTMGGGVSLVTGSGNNTIVVSGQPSDSPLTIVCGAGDDQVQVQVSSSSGYSNFTQFEDGIPNFVLFGSNAANDTLQVTDVTGGGVIKTTPFNATDGEVTVSYATPDALLSTIFFNQFTVG